MKSILIPFCVFSFFFASCTGSPKKEDAAFETDFCGWKVVSKYNGISFDAAEATHTLLLEKERERQTIFVLDDVYSKYEVGDTICISKKSVI